MRFYEILWSIYSVIYISWYILLIFYKILRYSICIQLYDIPKNTIFMSESFCWHLILSKLIFNLLSIININICRSSRTYCQSTACNDNPWSPYLHVWNSTDASGPYIINTIISGCVFISSIDSSDATFILCTLNDTLDVDPAHRPWQFSDSLSDSIGRSSRNRLIGCRFSRLIFNWRQRFRCRRLIF